MKRLLKLLEARQGQMSNEKFANKIGLAGTTVWRYRAGKSVINAPTRQKMIQYFLAKNDAEMVGALLAYRTGSELSSRQLSELGQQFLVAVQNNTPAALAA